MKKYDQIMVLGTLDGLERCDMGGRYLGEVTRGSKKGLHKVEINSTQLHFPLDQIMKYEEYFDIFWGRKPGKFPEKAVGRPWFLKGDYKGSLNLPKE